jgi:hypothetical protein
VTKIERSDMPRDVLRTVKEWNLREGTYWKTDHAKWGMIYGVEVCGIIHWFRHQSNTWVQYKRESRP